MTLGTARKSKSKDGPSETSSKEARGGRPGASGGGVPLFVKATTQPEVRDEVEVEPTHESIHAQAPTRREDATPDPAIGAIDPPPRMSAPTSKAPSAPEKPSVAADSKAAAVKPVPETKPAATDDKRTPPQKTRASAGADEEPHTETESADSETESTDELVTGSEPSPDVAAADEATDQSDDPQTAQARLDTVVGEMHGGGMRSHDAITVARDDATNLLQRRAADATDRVRGDARRTAKAVSSLFDAERKVWSKTFDGADKAVSALSLFHQAMTWIRGIGMIVGVSSLITKTRDTVEKTITSSIDRVEKIKVKHQTTVHDRTVKLATDARGLGESKAASYHDGDQSLRKTKQNAVRKMGNDFAAGAAAKEPEAKQSIADGVEKVPGDLRKEGDKLKAELVDPTPKVAPAVIGGAKATSQAVGEQSQLARDALRTAGKEAIGELHAGERDALQGVMRIRTMAEGQIRRTLRRGRKVLRRSSDRLLEELDGVIIDATAKLREPSKPHIGRSRRFAAWVNQRIERTANRFVEALPPAVDALAEPLFQIADEARRQFGEARAHTITALGEQRALMQTRLGETLGEVDKMFGSIVKIFTDVLDETTKEIKGKLETATADLEKRISDSLTSLDTQIEGKVKEVYDAADAKLPDLGKKMDKAVEKIDWDDRHPILSTLRDIGGFLLGLIVSILKWAFKLLLFLLAALLLIILLVIAGVSLAVALVVVAVIAVVALVASIAYATYQRHEEAKKKGLDRGFFANLGLGFCDTVGFTKMYIAITAEGLTPYERGKMFGEGLTDLVDVALVFVGVRGAIKNLKIAKPVPFESANLGDFRGLAKVERALAIEHAKTPDGALKMPRMDRMRAVYEGFKEGFGDAWAKIKTKTKIDENAVAKRQRQIEEQRRQQEQQRQQHEEQARRQQEEQRRQQEEQARRQQEEQRRQQEEQQRQQEEQQRQEQAAQQRQQQEQQRQAEQQRQEQAEQQRQRQQQEEHARRERERQQRDERERQQDDAKEPNPARGEADRIWTNVFEGKQHGRDMFRAARDELANATSLSPKEKADLFEALAKEINRRDPSWQANRSEAVDANGEVLAGFFTGEARPFGFAIDGKGRVFQTMNVMEGFLGVDGAGRMKLDLAKWTPISPTPPGGRGPSGGDEPGGGSPPVTTEVRPMEPPRVEPEPPPKSPEPPRAAEPPPKSTKHGYRGEWPPPEPGPRPKNASAEEMADWRYKRYARDSFEKDVPAHEILTPEGYGPYANVADKPGARPGRGGGPAQQATRKGPAAEEGFVNTETTQLGSRTDPRTGEVEANMVDGVRDNSVGAKDYLEVDVINKNGLPPKDMRAKLKAELEALKPGETLEYWDKTDPSRRIGYEYGEDPSVVDTRKAPTLPRKPRARKK